MNKIDLLEKENQQLKDTIFELEDRIHDANLMIAVHWSDDEDTNSALKDIEESLKPKTTPQNQ